MSKLFSLLGILIFVLNVSVSADESCVQQEFDTAIVCEKNFRANSLADLERYKTESHLKSRNLTIAFDLLGDENIELHTPCLVRYHKDFKINTTGDICLDARDGIRLHAGKNISANNIHLYSKKIIAIQKEATINVNSISLVSNGESADSRVHIRNTSSVNAVNLNLYGTKRATLGYSSFYNITGAINIESRDEFSSIWRDTQIITPQMSIISDTEVRLANNVVIESTGLSAQAPECKLRNMITLGTGSCFDISRPTSRIKKVETQVLIGETLTFDSSRSSATNGILEHSFSVNGEVLQKNEGNIFTYTFNQEGIYYVKSKIVDNLGYVSTAQRKITVSAPITNDREAFFKYAVEDGMLELIFIQSIPRDQITSAKFIVNEQEYNLPSFYHLDSIFINDIASGAHDVTLEVTDIYNQVFRYQRKVFVGTNEEMEIIAPVMEFDIIPSAPKEVFIEFRGVFDPARLFDGLVIDWGDGEVSEHWVPDEGGAKHSYQSIGTYEVNVEFIKAGENGETVKTLTKQVTVTNEEVAAQPPLVNFRYEKQYFAPHVAFNIDLSMSPTGEIVSRTFDYGDGTVYTGNEPIHTHFYDPGTYYATLTVVDEYGMSASQTARVIIAEEGEDFISNLECFDEGGLYVGCDVVALAKEEEIQSIEIDWGDGSVETFDPASSSWTWDFFDYEYSEPDNYVIQITVTTSYGSYVDSVEYNNQEVKEDLAPYVSFNCHSPSSLKVSCQNQSTDDGVIVSSIWNVNGVEYTSFNLDEVSVSESGNVNVSLTVTDDNGLSATANQVIFVNGNIAPIASFDCSQSIHTQLSCVSTSRDSDGYIASSFFYINDQVYEGQSVIIELLDESPLDIEHRVIDNEGKVTTLSKTIEVNKSPVIQAECSQKEADRIECNALGTYDDSEGLDFKWNFNEYTYEGSVVSIKPSSYGKFSIELIVTDNLAAETKAKINFNYLNINGTPLANYAYMIDTNLKVIFNASLSQSNFTDVKEFKWYVNGEIIITESYVLEYLFPLQGEYTVKLETKGSNNIVTEHSEIINVFNLAVPYPDRLENASTLIGVDSDNDLIRDDIQRGLENYAKGNSDLLQKLKNVQVENTRLLSVMTELEVNEAIFKREKAVFCLSQYFKSQNLVNYDQLASSLAIELEGNTFDNVDRVIKRVEIYDLYNSETRNEFNEEDCLN
ncbi:PKD domain-containing protein [Halobacteriovorax sp. RZ-1]|uniref:PKD domain-containing protein n=1 Tax=unclassified Halobacteriovorax TaxID=2639665 RepID=UPI0037248B72